MNKTNIWLKRPVTSLCIICGIVIISIFIIFNKDANQKSYGEASIMIIQRHYGINAREMERTVAIPMEDIISNIPEIENIVTISENSQVRCYVRLRHNASSQHIYSAIREAAQRIYETLPPSAQRPEINSSNETGIPVWIAALWGQISGDYIERTVKPAFEAIEGVANIEISGTGNKQIFISPDPEKIAALGLNPYYIASILNMNDSIYSGGILRNADFEIPIIIDNRYECLDALKNAYIPYESGIIQLKDIALVYESEREGDIISRLDGQRTIVMAITAASGTNLGVLSRDINKKLNDIFYGSFEYKILQDRGAEETIAFRLVLVTAIISSILVALASLFLIRKNNGSLYPGFICAASIPIISIISSAFLSVIGFPIDRKLLAGLSIGIGAAADAVLLTADGFARNRTMLDINILASIFIPLVSAAATTIAALFPLVSFSEAENISVIVWALGTVTLISMLVSLIFLPPLLIWANNFMPFSKNTIWQNNIFYCFSNCFIKKIKRQTFRLLAMLTGFCYKRAYVSIGFSLFISIFAVILLLIAGTDISNTEVENSVYARVEFESGFVKEEIDNRLAIWASNFKDNSGIDAVQTSARTGSGQILVAFDQRKIKSTDVRNLLRLSSIPGGFIYIPEPTKEDQIWEIKIYGDDDIICRELVEKAAALCSTLPQILEVVLNFKDGNPRLTLSPQRERFAEANISFAHAADNLRRWVHGPVIYKRFNDQSRDIDVRLGISGLNDQDNPAIDNYLRLPLVSINGSQAGSIRLDSLNESKMDFEPSHIRRDDRRRMASFSIRTKTIDPRKIRAKTMKALEKMELPKGYVIDFDPDAIKRAEAISGTGFRVLASLLFCYMVIASANESLKFPLLVLASIPPSLAVPIIFLVLTGTVLNASIACSLVAVCGIAVNASIIIAAEFKRATLEFNEPVQFYFNRGIKYYYSVIRQCIPVLFSTTGTTIIGALPFLILLEGSNSILRDLSFVTIFGVASSLICSIVLIPSFIVISENLSSTLSRSIKEKFLPG